MEQNENKLLDLSDGLVHRNATEKIFFYVSSTMENVVCESHEEIRLSRDLQPRPIRLKDRYLFGVFHIDHCGPLQ